MRRTGQSPPTKSTTSRLVDRIQVGHLFTPGGLTMMRWGWLVVGILLSRESPACAGGKPQPQSEQKIKALIDQLVQPNPKPITGDEDARQAPDYRLPPSFDRKKQKQVHRARSKLT